MSEKNGANGSEEKVICPRSNIGCGRGEDLHNIHEARQAELAAHGGVCAACHNDIRRHHTKMQKGDTERPAEFSVLHRTKDLENHLALDNHAVVQFADFDYTALDELHGEIEAQPADARAMAAELISRIFVWVWSNQNPRTALVKFSALSAGLRDDLVGRDYPAIARELGVTKQCVSKAATGFQDAFGFKFVRSRSKESRARMAEAARGHPGANKRKPTTPVR